MLGKTQVRERGSRDRWLNAAYELLILGGIDAVKIMPLAKRLNLTRTGFYWFFDDLSALHDAMIDRWERQNTDTLVQHCQMQADTIIEALFNLMDCWLNPNLFDAKLDLAIRNWARTDGDLQDKVDTADLLRIRAVTEMFQRFGYSPEQAEVRGMTVIYTQIGYISMDVTEDRTERLNRVQHYVELFAGSAASQHEVDQFVRRNMQADIQRTLSNERPWT